jgi:hypothetical protein
LPATAASQTDWPGKKIGRAKKSAGQKKLADQRLRLIKSITSARLF